MRESVQYNPVWYGNNFSAIDRI